MPTSAWSLWTLINSEVSKLAGACQSSTSYLLKKWLVFIGFMKVGLIPNVGTSCRIYIIGLTFFQTDKTKINGSY